MDIGSISDCGEILRLKLRVLILGNLNFDKAWQLLVLIYI
jgi:hypothetical protein